MKADKLQAKAAIGIGSGVASSLLVLLNVPFMVSLGLGALLVVILTNGLRAEWR